MKNSTKILDEDQYNAVLSRKGTNVRHGETIQGGTREEGLGVYLTLREC